jgi:hypothetical protein
MGKFIVFSSIVYGLTNHFMGELIQEAPIYNKKYLSLS